MWRVVLLYCFVPALAVAQPTPRTEPAPVDKPGAVQLFEQGRADLAAGNVDAACKKFEQSLLKDPRAVGTLLNLALCNERQGKVASALGLFIEAYDRANEASSPEERAAAEEHITTLRPLVPFLVLSRTGAPIAGEKLLIDDKGRRARREGDRRGPRNPRRDAHRARPVAIRDAGLGKGERA